MIEIIVLGRPRGKERPRGTKDGHFYTPEKTRSYEAALKYAAIEVMGDRPPLDGPLSVKICIRVPVPQSWSQKKRDLALANRIYPTGKPDWDNHGKMIDALNLVVWIDDSQIVKGEVIKTYSEKPGMWVRVWPVIMAGVFE